MKKLQTKQKKLAQINPVDRIKNHISRVYNKALIIKNIIDKWDSSDPQELENLKKSLAFHLENIGDEAYEASEVLSGQQEFAFYEKNNNSNI